MLAYLTLLYDPSPPELIRIEEPENHLTAFCLSWLKSAAWQQTGRS